MYLDGKEYKELSCFFTEQLQIEKTLELIKSIIFALGACGNVDAVEPLLNIKSILLRSAVKSAVLKIQSRLGPTEKGSLSISGINTEAGSLSIMDYDLGSLSIKDKNE